MRGNPDVRTTGTVLGSVLENPDVTPSKVPLSVGDLDPI